MADTTSKTFAENVNHVAELDNSLGYELELRRSNIMLNDSTVYSALAEVRLFNRATNETETVSVPAASVTAAGLDAYLGAIKTALEAAYPECVMTHNVTQGTFSNVQIAVVLSGNDYYLRSINIKISEPDGVQYDIDGQLVAPLEIMPNLAALTVETIADVSAVTANEANINAVAANKANIDAVAESLANINTIASIQNLANMTTVANDLNSMDLNGIADVTVVANNLVLGAASSINIVSADKANIDAVAANKTNIDAVAANEANINAVIGSAAATAADVLLTHADVALTHADVVLTNADVVSANASADIATTQAGIATTKASEALVSANASEASRVAADANALSASASASTATTKASEASASATEADLSATAATTKADEASVSAANAATSESNASTSEANALASANTAAAQAGIATTKASEASASAMASATSAALAEAALDDITGLTVSATTLAAGAPATASYDSETGILYIGVPQGLQGIQGLPGVDGQDIIHHVSRTLGDGSAGTTDTYTVWGDLDETINLGTFLVYNGTDGQVSGTASIKQTSYIATTNQTVFNIEYDVGYVQVYVNGGKLAVSDFTATDGTSVVLHTGSDPGDVVECVGFVDFVASMGVGWADIANKPTTFAPSTHNHNALYYTETEIDTLLSGKAETVHTHEVSDITDFSILFATITTDEPSGVSLSTMTLNGSVESFGMTDMDALTVGFEYKRSVDWVWTATAQVTKNTLGEFSANISGLSALTSYDIRAVAYDTLNPIFVSYGTTLTQSTTATEIPNDPTNTGSFPSTLNKYSTTQFTFSGATDTDGTVTHYLVEQISSANLTVTTAEVVAGSAHTFTVGAISADEAVSFVVKAKDNAGAYSLGITVNVTLKNYVGIGTAGAMDFGVAPSLEAFAVRGLAEITGTTTPGHDNWGNYIHTNGSIMVHVPKFYYRIGNASAPQYATYGLNSVEIAGADVYADEASANAAGFALHRAFIDGGVVKDGFFIDKYLNSKKVGDANVAVSVKNGNPIGLTTSTAYSTPSSTMTGCTGILADAVVLSRARGEGFNTASVFMYGALALLSIAHGQMATSTMACAWYDAARTTNFPKGCNNNALADVNDTSVTWTGNGVSAAVGLTGSASNFAKSTHNGQNSGIADLNGLFYEPALGLTNIGTTATSSTQVTTNTIYVLKQSATLASLTAGWNGATDAWANANNLATRYDAITSPITVSASAGKYWGSGTNQVFDPALSGVGRDLCGVLPKNDTADSATGTNLCGNDSMYHSNIQNMLPLFGGTWGSAADAGVLYRFLNYYRSKDSTNASFRAAAYV